MLRDRGPLGRKAPVFTLQWHLTNACDASCRHCYDRSSIEPLSLSGAVGVLDDLLAFCRARRVRGQVCLTGGNPFLFPSFHELYAATAARGFPISILGNPVPEEWLRRVVEVFRPVSYQVSLEGLAGTNDEIRGGGHFERTLRFLGLLRSLGIRSHVMLTLHRRNLDEVLPLAERLDGVADRFSFNRLAQVGEGADLELPTREEYAAFLESYARAARTRPRLGLKENLLGLVRAKGGRPARGCTGHGCGAAFNFVALLPDGEVHACRKLPSPIGHLARQTLSEIWASPRARCYRQGSRACGWCGLRNSCGGCLAVTYGAGRSPLDDRDPHCFAPERTFLPVVR